MGTVHWRGKTKIDQIRILVDDQYLTLDPVYHRRISDLWESLKQKYSQTLYRDGTLLWLRKITTSSTSLELHTSPIKYSTVRYLWENRDEFSYLFDGIEGILTTRYFISSQNQTYYLIGRRKETSRRSDNEGKWSNVGGAIEYQPTLISAKDLILSELHEEIIGKIDFSEDWHVSAIFKPNRMYSNLIVDITTEMDKDNPVKSNNEFAQNQLLWKSKEFICNLAHDQLFGSVGYLQRRLITENIQ